MIAAPAGPLSQAFASALTSTPQSSSSSSSSTASPLAALFAPDREGANASKRHRGLTPSIAIKNAKATPAVKPTYAPQNLALVSRSLRTILSPSAGGGQELTISLEQLYNVVESLVHVANAGSELYERLKMEGERAAVEVARQLKNQLSSSSWLAALAQVWQQWLQRMTIVSDVLVTLDTGYILYHPELHPTHLLLIDLFKHHVIDDEVIMTKALDDMSQSVNAERAEHSSTSTYRSLHATLLALFLRLDRYSAMEEKLLNDTRTFYSSEAAAHAGQGGPATASAEGLVTYLTHAQKRIDEETQRAQWLLERVLGRESLVTITRDELVKKQADWLTAGLPTLLLAGSGENLVPLTLLYRQLLSVGLLEPLTKVFVEHIIEVGSGIVNPASAAKASKVRHPPKSEEDKELLRQATADEEALIERLIAFKDTIDATVDQAFARHDSFVQRRKEGFEKVVNSRTGGGKVAELCAKYLDVKLKSGNRTMTDEELERCLDSALTLFRYTHAKDMFEEFYKRHFAKRLLLNRSASSDAEQSMLLKLKDECGPAFTQRLETMLKDITLSEETMKAFSAMHQRDGDDFELSVNVLTQAHWPTYPVVQVTIPPAMAAATERFQMFYAQQQVGRTLHWAHSLGTCVLKASFPKPASSSKKGAASSGGGEDVKELHVSEFQAIVLLLFNDVPAGEKLTYAAIKEQTGLEDVELKRTLQSLACGQIPTRVLRKDPQGRDVDPERDSFGLNEHFKNDRHRVRINQIQMRETREEQESTETRVLLDRDLVLQAAAVRVLKARKKLTHAELLQEVVDAIKSRFQVDVAEIKKTFEKLIEKEYMERVEGQRGVYQYLA